MSCDFQALTSVGCNHVGGNGRALHVLPEIRRFTERFPEASSWTRSMLWTEVAPCTRVFDQRLFLHMTAGNQKARFCPMLGQGCPQRLFDNSLPALPSEHDP